MNSNNTLKIEKNIPLPSPYGGITDVLRKMKPMDSVLLPLRARASLGTITKRLGMKYTTRAEGDSSVRVWKLE